MAQQASPVPLPPGAASPPPRVFGPGASRRRGASGGLRAAASALIVALALVGPARPVSADDAPDRVTLAEVLPALAGSALGALDLGAAPAPGDVRVVRASDIRRAIRAAGHDARGLAIPRTTRVRRDARRLAREEVERLLRPAVESSLAPCVIESVELPGALVLPAGTPTVTTDAVAPRASGRVAAPLVVRVGGREMRVLASARVACPEPVVTAGARVRIVVAVGAVRASAPGLAGQPGRPGDEIRVTNLDTRAQLRARVIDAQTVEVRP
jgi:hypothetical protein